MLTVLDLDLVERLDGAGDLRLRGLVEHHEAELVLALYLLEGPLGEVGPQDYLLCVFKPQPSSHLPLVLEPQHVERRFRPECEPPRDACWR